MLTTAFFDIVSYSFTNNPKELSIEGMLTACLILVPIVLKCNGQGEIPYIYIMV